MNQKGYIHIVVAILIVVMAVGLVGVAWYYEENKEEVTTSIITNKTNTNINTSGWGIYHNDELNFTIKYPNAWTAETIKKNLSNSDINHAVFSKGSCGNGGCAISRDVCEIRITEPYNDTSEITDMNSWLEIQPFYKGDDIIEITLGRFDAIKSKVAVTPIVEGQQGVGNYFLIKTSEYFLQATLGRGFNNEECKTEMYEILSTIIVEVGVDISDWETYKNEEQDTSDEDTIIKNGLNYLKTALILYSDDHSTLYPLLNKCFVNKTGCLGEYIDDDYIAEIPSLPLTSIGYYYCSKEVYDADLNYTYVVYAIWGINSKGQIIGIYTTNDGGSYYKDVPPKISSPCELLE